MRRVFAIAALTVRTAVRSRVLLVLLALLLAVLVGLPLTVKGDGTIEGAIQILLSYTLGFAGAILSMVTVWAGCAALSTEIKERQIHLLVTKPVRPLELWMGKWLGLLAVNAVLLLFAGAVVYGLIQWRTRPSRVSAEDRRTLRDEIFVARARVFPEQPDVSAAARAELEQRRAAGTLPAEISEASAYKLLNQHLLQQAFSVAPGGRTVWRVVLPFSPEPGRPATFQFRFSTSALGNAPVQGRWTFGPPGGDTPWIALPGAWEPLALHRLPLDADRLAGRTLDIAFENTHSEPVHLFFEPDSGLELLLYRGRFEANFARALLTQFFRLAFLAAVGLTAGALLSLPVAAFAALFAVFLIRLGPYVRTMAQGGQFLSEGPNTPAFVVAVDRVVQFLFQGIEWVVAPFQVVEPLDLLATGRLVSWGFVGQVFLMQAVLYAGLLWLLCGALLRRRELGLPEG